uniref:Uncharacterized protein n=1 Tax=viral metagenome TaxID=1070528 RepID=A0A6C0L3V1_9ZZZZ|tara:strand:- start:287 stop:601 length:315 start_codon:yes stop_codon:yes gene_type:complete
MPEKQSPQKLIQDLLSFYVKKNYENYLKTKGIQKIPTDEIQGVVEKIYIDRKQHMKEFLKTSLKKIMKEEYVGDLFVNNVCNDIFQDDALCVNRIIQEIQLYQR